MHSCASNGAHIFDVTPDIVLLRSNSGTGEPVFLRRVDRSFDLSYPSAINRIGVTYGEAVDADPDPQSIPVQLQKHDYAFESAL